MPRDFSNVLGEGLERRMLEKQSLNLGHIHVAGGGKKVNAVNNARISNILFPV